MSRKFKKLVRSVSEKSGVSHAGAVNLLRRGDPAPLKDLDPVLIRSKAKPVFGEHTHEAGIVSAVLPGGDVIVTPAAPRNTMGGVSFWRYEPIVRYRAEDVRPYRLKKGERFARFVETVFDVRICFNQSYKDGDIMNHILVEKPADKTCYIIGEEGESVTAVMKPRLIIIPLWETLAILEDDGKMVGQDAVKIVWAVRDRMLALIDCANMDHDLQATGPDRGPRGHQVNLSAPPDGTEWYVNDIDDNLSKDRGIVYDTPPSHSLFRYACGRGKVGRHISGPTFSGLYLCEGEVSVVAPSRL